MITHCLNDENRTAHDHLHALFYISPTVGKQSNQMHLYYYFMSLNSIVIKTFSDDVNNFICGARYGRACFLVTILVSEYNSRRKTRYYMDLFESRCGQRSWRASLVHASSTRRAYLGVVELAVAPCRHRHAIIRAVTAQPAAPLCTGTAYRLSASLLTRCRLFTHSQCLLHKQTVFIDDQSVQIQ